jgi:hypothetical protein
MPTYVCEYCRKTVENLTFHKCRARHLDFSVGPLTCSLFSECVKARDKMDVQEILSALDDVRAIVLQFKEDFHG